MAKAKKRKRAKKGKQGGTIIRDKHLLYSAAVQSVDTDNDFFERIYKKMRGEKFRRLREDFCGTAALACDWVQRREQNEAWGVDLDGPTLDWGRQHYLPKLGTAAARLHLLQQNVLEVHRPQVDVVCAQNFSYFVFKTRDLLGRYFRQVHRSLRPGGVFFIDTLGGTESMDELEEKRRIATSKAFNGVKVPGFTYVWEQKRFNPIDHDFQCRIHFKLKDGTKLRRAFTYDWRLWTLPELRELLLDAGFKTADVYTEGWDDDEDDTDGIFRKRKWFDNQSAWVAYVVAGV